MPEKGGSLGLSAAEAEAMGPGPHRVPAPDNVETIPTDAAVAADIRAVAEPLVRSLCTVMNQAREHGLTVSFTIALDAYGRHKLDDLTIVRPL